MLFPVLVFIAAISLASATTCNKPLLTAQMDKIHADAENGGEFYKLFFEMLPDVKKYFPEKFTTTAEVAHMPFYQNQGKKFLTMLKKVVHDCDNEEALKHDVHELLKIHDEKKVPLEVVKTARPVVLKFLTEKAGMSEEQKAAWKALRVQVEKLLEQEKHH